MNTLLTIAVLYGLLLIGGGIQAYVSSKSLVSLIAAGGCGAIVLAGAALAKSKPTIGFAVVGLISVAIMGRFAPKAFKESQIWPAMVFVIASAVVFLALIAGHFLLKRAPADVGGSTTGSDQGPT